MAKPPKKVYVVETAPGQYKLYDNWPDCQRAVSGKRVSFAGGPNREAAIKKLLAGKQKLKQMRKTPLRSLGGGNPSKSKPKPVGDLPKVGITSDAGTHGNPGPCEFQVTDLSGKVLIHKHLGVHTNNYAELAGIGAGLQWAIANDEKILWTDSKIAMIWIKSGKLGPTVHERDALMKMITKIRKLLEENPQLEIRKWETKTWGEIPADFGRK